VVAYGYRYGEVPLPTLPPVKTDAEVIRFKESDPTVRPPVKVSLGCHLAGATMPHPDPSDTTTMLAGVSKRFAVAPPPAEPALVADLRGFVRKWVRTNLTPLSPDSDTSEETWLASTNYPEWRKAELRKCNPDALPVHLKPEWQHCKSFGKDESYPA
jgi:hypothetical protein